LIHIAFILVLLATAAAFAILEIQIEGDAGWAEDLPTWRINNHWTRLLFGSRPLTGYHLWVHIVVILLVHLPYALGFVAPTLRTEMRIIAFLVLFWILEDFLWFVFNPRFGVVKFRREHVWWHAPSWWWIMPREYWIFLPIGVAIYIASWRG
jgi:hypothetical protein